MMRSGGGDLQGSLGMRLASDLGQIHNRPGRCRGCGCRGRWSQRGSLLPVRLQFSKMSEANHWRGRGDARFRDVRHWNVEPLDTEPVEMRDDRQRTADLTKRPIERELAQPCHLRRQGAAGAGIDDGGGHRKVESTALFAKLRRRQVDGHPPAGKVETAVVDRDLHPLARFLQGAVPQTDDVKARQAVGDIRLNVDANTLEAEQGSGQGPGQHQAHLTLFCVSSSANATEAMDGARDQRRRLPVDSMEPKLAAARALGWITTVPFRVGGRHRLGARLLGNGRLRISGPGRVILAAGVNAWSHAEVNRLLTTRPDAVIEIGRNARLNGCTIVAALRVEVGAD